MLMKIYHSCLNLAEYSLIFNSYLENILFAMVYEVSQLKDILISIHMRIKKYLNYKTN